MDRWMDGWMKRQGDNRQTTGPHLLIFNTEYALKSF